MQALDLTSCIGLRASAGHALAALKGLRKLQLPEFAFKQPCSGSCALCAAKNYVLAHLTGVYPSCYCRLQLSKHSVMVFACSRVRIQELLSCQVDDPSLPIDALCFAAFQ